MVVVGVLGPVVLHGVDGTAVPVGSGRQRRLLAALTLQAGSAVDRDVLAELVWADEQPADPVAALQTYVARLRRLLPGSVTITTGPRSYQLDVATDAVDATRFRAQLSAAADTPDPALRLDRLDSALGLWRGRPFDEFDHPAVEPEIARLTGLRATALEDRAETLLALGRIAEAVAGAAALVTAEPLRERAVALLIRAQVAAGRPAEALRTFARLRAELAEQLGIDPSVELVALHERVLRQEIRPAPNRAPPCGSDQLVHRAGRRRRPGPPGAGPEQGGDAERAGRGRQVPAGPARGRRGRRPVRRRGDRRRAGGRGTRRGRGRRRRRAAAHRRRARQPDRPGGRSARRSAQLLVLDDCEHVADAVAGLVEEIVLGAPRVDVLATSREALRIDGEQVLPIRPLSGGAAAELLADRVRAGDPDGIHADDAGLLDLICARLDRLPLALELAAARVPAVGLSGLLAALTDPHGDPLAALGRGRRTAAPRHRSLRDVVEWSVRLLDDEARELFIRLGVFAGPVEPAAIAAVCGTTAASAGKSASAGTTAASAGKSASAGTNAASAGTERTLADLVDRSLVLRQGPAPITYGMLETLRAFGRERLAADRESTALRTRHASWMVGLVVDTGAARSRPDEAAAIRRFDAHLADLGTAHTWLCAHGPLEDLLRLGMVCAELGYQRARADLARMVDEALAAAGCDPAGGGAADATIARHPLVPRLLGLSAVPQWQRGDLDGAERRCRRALALAEGLGDPLLGRDALWVLCNVASFRGESGPALELGERAAALSAQAGDDTTHASTLADMTIIAAYAGDDGAAAAHEVAATRLAEQMGWALALGWAAYAAGERRAEAGEPGAAAFLERAVALAAEVDAVFLAGVARHTLLTTAARADDPEQALTRFGPLLDTWHGMGAWTQLWIAVRALAEALSRRGRHADAALLLGALRASPRASVEYGADSARVRAVEAAAREALGDRFAVLQAEGAALGDVGAVALARRLAR